MTHRCAFPHQALLGHNSLSLSTICIYLPQNRATLCKTALLAGIRTCTDMTYHCMQMHAISCNDYTSRIHSAHKIWWPEHPGPKSGQKGIMSQSCIPSLSTVQDKVLPQFCPESCGLIKARFSIGTCCFRSMASRQAAECHRSWSYNNLKQ